MKVKSESEVTQSCPTLRNPMDCSPPGSSVHGIFQARVLEWGAITFSDALVMKPNKLCFHNLSHSTPQEVLTTAKLENHWTGRVLRTLHLEETLEGVDDRLMAAQESVSTINIVTDLNHILPDPMQNGESRASLLGYSCQRYIIRI